MNITVIQTVLYIALYSMENVSGQGKYYLAWKQVSIGTREEIRQYKICHKKLYLTHASMEKVNNDGHNKEKIIELWILSL